MWSDIPIIVRERCGTPKIRDFGMFSYTLEHSSSPTHLPNVPQAAVYLIF
jgi:hypothetical protein